MKRMKSSPRSLRPEIDTTSTMLISNRELTLDGVTFQWWAVGEHPSLVTVRSSVFGTLADFARSDPEAFAKGLAKKVLAQHYEKAAAFRKASHNTLKSKQHSALDWTEMRPADRDAFLSTSARMRALHYQPKGLVALEIEEEGPSEKATRHGLNPDDNQPKG